MSDHKFKKGVSGNPKGRPKSDNSGLRDKLPTSFKARELQQRGWQGLTTNKSIMDALNLLCEHGYLIEETEPTRGRPATSYYWNKKMQKG